MGQLVFQATLGGQVNLVGPNTASTYNINVPAVAGNMVTTGDTGTVTNTMLAGSIANAKLTNSSVTIGSTSVSLGATSTTLDGVTIGGTTPGAVTATNSLATGGFYAKGAMSASYTDGIVTDYSTGLGRISVGSSDGLAFYTGGVATTELMRLDSSGNLGIGTSSPGAKLDVRVSGATTTLDGLAVSNGTASGIFKVTGATYSYRGVGSNVLWVGGDTTPMYVGPSTAQPLILGNAAYEYARIDTSGNVGIGTSSPSYKTEISAASATNGIGLRVTNSGSTGAGIDFLQSGVDNFSLTMPAGSGGLRFIASGSNERMRIDSSGYLLVGQTAAVNQGRIQSKAAGGVGYDTYQGYSSAAAFTFAVSGAGQIYAVSTTISAISDQRLKENIRDLDDGLQTVMALKPRKYDWKEGKGADTKNARGFIAQEFEQVLPDLIDEWREPAPEGEEPYKSVRQDLLPILVKAIQEQQAIITQQAADIAALKTKVGI